VFARGMDARYGRRLHLSNGISRLATIAAADDHAKWLVPRTISVASTRAVDDRR
jgi:hypothetical protein